MHPTHEDKIEQRYFIEEIELGRRVVYALSEVEAWGAEDVYWWQTHAQELEHEDADRDL